jgi:hypothetical protein
LQDRRGPIEWSKVLELLSVNRLCDPQSELGVHQRWFGSTAMNVILGTDEAVAAKDRLYRALDKALQHKEALETHWAKRWRDLFGANCQLLLYDLTSTYFEGQAAGASKVDFGYSRASPARLPPADLSAGGDERKAFRSPTKSLRATAPT